MRFPNANNVKDYTIDTRKLNIDLSDDYFLQNPIRRIEYLQNKDSIKTFQKDKLGFTEELKKVYEDASKNTHCTDIYSLFKNRLNNNIITDTIQPYRNILILFTDGYIESGTYKNFTKKGNKKTYLDKKSIDNFRRAFESSGEESIKEFFIKNSTLQHLEVLAVEFYDRSRNENGNPRKELNDYEILKLFWEDWLQKSGVKRFETHEYVDSVEDFENIWKKFIKSN